MLNTQTKPIWLILPDPQIEAIANSALTDHTELDRWCHICVADSVAAVPIAKHAVSRGAKAIISRGGTASLLRDIFPCTPIIDIEPNIPLITLRYFDLVKEYGQGNVFLFAAKAFLPSETQREDLKEYGYNIQLFKETYSNSNVESDAYCLSVNDLAPFLKARIGDVQSPIFVLGDASACAIAKEMGIPNEIIQSSKNEILEAIQNSLSLIRKVFVGQAMTLPEVEVAIEKAIKPVLQEFGFEVLTQIDRYGPGTINADMLEEMKASNLIIIDITGERPNCYFEIGYGKGLNKPVIITAKDGTKLHFDIAGERCLLWKSWEDLDAKLRRALAEMGYPTNRSSC